MDNSLKRTEPDSDDNGMLKCTLEMQNRENFKFWKMLTGDYFFRREVKFD